MTIRCYLSKRAGIWSGRLICIPMTSELSWVAESLEGAIDLSDDVRCASSDVLVGDIVCMKW